MVRIVMGFRHIAVAMAILNLAPLPSNAQPADLPIPAATATQYPPGVTVKATPRGPVYADAQGRTLYGMDMRTLVRWNPDPAKFCQGACSQIWEPLLAPAGSQPNIAFPLGFGDRARQQRQDGAATGASPPTAQPLRQGPPPLPPGFVQPQSAPDWTIIAGPQGPQWVYKGWHVVYTRKGDKPGSTAFDGTDEFTWNTLKFVPPIPKLVAPPGVSAIFADGAYALADGSGHVLFTGTSGGGPAAWTPLNAPMAGHGLGDWAVSLASDSPQWTYRGLPVFVSKEDNPVKVPAAGTILRP